MSVHASRITVGTTPTLLTAGQDRGPDLARSAAISNPGPATVAIGGSNVAADTGFQLPEGGSVSVDLAKGELLYGIVASGTQDVDVLQVGV